MSAPRPFETDPFHPLGSICTIKQFLYIHTNLQVISSMWDAQVCIYDNYACALAETIKLRFGAIFFIYDNYACALAETIKLRFGAIFEVIILFLRVHAGAY